MIPLALVVFFLSGIAALLYQVIWQRMLVMFSGADIYSSTIIVAAFMAGLGLGSFSGGLLADRASRRANLVLFAVAELAIAAFSASSTRLYYHELYGRLGPLALDDLVVSLLLFLSLLWPTFFMGMSLPLLARALTPTIERASAVIGLLYGVNTLGAAVGAIAGTWFLLPRFGLETSLQIGAALNVISALVALPLAARVERRARTPDAAAVEADPSSDVGRSGLSPLLLWATAAALSGWLALSLEIVWFRLLGVMVKSTAFTFGTLLAIYLTGLGVGSLAGGFLAPRLRRPAAAFLAIQVAVAASAAVLLSIFVGSVDGSDALGRYFAAYESLDVRASVGQLRARLGDGGPAPLPSMFLVMYVGVPALLILPPTFLMGVSFPVLQRVVQTDLAQLGRRVGLLLVANIAGSVAGTVLTGWVMLNALGTSGTVRATTAFTCIFAATGAALWTRVRAPGEATRVVPLALLLGALALALAVPRASTLWARLHGASPDRVIFGEDATGLSVIRLEEGVATGSARATVFVNGLGQSTIPYGDVHTALGMLPAFLHPAPSDAAVIGLGSGDTVYGVAGRRDIERIVAIEIIRPQLDTLKRFAERQPYGGVAGLLRDPRVTHVSGDGRIYLTRSERRFDIIEADALRPTSAYSGNLYSDEYFRLVRARLRPNGLAATWSPTARVHNAFVRVFPHVVSVPGVLLGSETPIGIDRRAIAARLAEPGVREHYAAAGVDAERLMQEYLANPARYTPDFDRAALEDFNTDLFPKDEFDLSPRR